METSIIHRGFLAGFLGLGLVRALALAPSPAQVSDQGFPTSSQQSASTSTEPPRSTDYRAGSWYVDQHQLTRTGRCPAEDDCQPFPGRLPSTSGLVLS